MKFLTWKWKVEVFPKKKKNINYNHNTGDDSEEEEQDWIVPLIGGACLVCLIVLITIISLYYCKVVRKNNEKEIKHENPVYDAWNDDYAGENYVKDANTYYEK